MSLEGTGSNPGNAASVKTEQQPLSMRDRFSKVKYGIKNKLTDAWFDLAAPVIQLGAENIIRNTAVEYEEGFDEGIKAARERGDIIVFVTNHQSLVDSIACLKPPRRVRKLLGRLKIALPYTKLLTTGDKGASVKGFSDTMAPTLANDEVKTVMLIREQDEELGEEANSNEAREELVQLVCEDYDMMIHAEGKLDASRRNETGTRNGMQPLLENSLRSVMLMAKQLHKGVTIVPMTVSGTYNIYDAARGETDPKTGQTRGALTRHAIRDGLDLRNEVNKRERPLVRIYVSKPMRTDEGELGEIMQTDKHNWNRFNSVIGKIIASHLPLKMRGAYTNDETLKVALEKMKIEEIDKRRRILERRRLRMAQS
jgi:1-acyl-sn-glycerol-3-phosphate acyltransferase